MAKRITKVEGTVVLGTVKAENTIKCSGYNPWQTGTGVHGGGKKERNRKTRKEGKKICRQDW